MCGRGGALSPRVGHVHGRLHSTGAFLPSPGALKEPVFGIRIEPRLLGGVTGSGCESNGVKAVGVLN